MDPSGLSLGCNGIVVSFELVLLLVYSNLRRCVALRHDPSRAPSPAEALASLDRPQLPRQRPLPRRPRCARAALNRSGLRIARSGYTGFRGFVVGSTQARRSAYLVRFLRLARSVSLRQGHVDRAPARVPWPASFEAETQSTRCPSAKSHNA